MNLLRSVTKQFGARATVHTIESADHAFSVLVRSGGTDVEALEEVVDTLARWTAGILAT